jgi:ATP-binding cassette subfamily F protein 3
VFKPIGVLSGGERNRYALARMLLHPSNFLLLDEPTNHLDLQAKDVLLEALKKFTGTIVFVSHDRYFIDNLATRVFEVADGTVNVFPGNYEDYLWRKQGAPADLTLPGVVTPNHNGGIQLMPAPEPKAPKPRVNPMKLQKLQDRCQELEARIGEIEEEIQQHETSLAEFHSAEESIRAAERIEQLRADLSSTMREWEEVAQTIEAHS